MDISLGELIRRIVREEVRYLHTNMVGRVAAINSDDTDRVDVQPLVQRTVVSAEAERITYRKLPVVRNVPIVLPASAASEDRIKVAVGDWVELRCSMFPLDELIKTDVGGQPVEPQDPRLHALRDAVAVPIPEGFKSRSQYSVNADREIIADDVRIGRPVDAAGLAFTGSTQEGVDKIVNPQTTPPGDPSYTPGAIVYPGLKGYIDAAAAAGGPPPGVQFPLSPVIEGTDHLKGS